MSFGGVRFSGAPFASKSGGNPTLFGVATTAATGSLANTVTRGLTGQSVTSAHGNLGKTRSRGLTGASGSFTQGTERPTNLEALSGVQIGSVQQGAEKPNNTQALTGQSITSVRGSVLATQRLTGQSITLSQGTESPVKNKALSGSAITSARGSVTDLLSDAAEGDFNTFAGQPFAAGTFAATEQQLVIQLELTGQSSTLQQGTERPLNAQPLTGIAITSNRGNLTEHNSNPLTGGSITLSQGNETPSQRLTGASITSARGTIDITRRFSGQAITAAQGNEIVTRTKALTGQSITSARGNLVELNSNPLTGQAIAVQSGDTDFERKLPSGEDIAASIGSVGNSVAKALTGLSTSIQIASNLVELNTNQLIGQAIAVAYGESAITNRLSASTPHSANWSTHGSNPGTAINNYGIAPDGTQSTYRTVSSNPHIYKNVSIDSTFTRASTGTYVDSTDGLLKTADVDERRFEGGKLLVEGTSTNLVRQSEAVYLGPWGGLAQAEAADGTVPTYRGLPFSKVYKTTTGTSEARVQPIGTVTSGESRTFTFALLAGNTNTVLMGLYDTTAHSWGVNADSTAEIIEGPGTVARLAGGAWYFNNLSTTTPTLARITRTYQSTGNCQIYCYPGNHTSTTIGHYVFLTRVQVEEGTDYSSYIPTTTAVASRAADVVNYYTYSVFVKPSSPSDPLALYADGSIGKDGVFTGLSGRWANSAAAPTLHGNNIVKATLTQVPWAPDWVRLAVTYVPFAGTGFNHHIYPMLTSNPLEWWGAMVNVGTEAEEFVPTSGSVYTLGTVVADLEDDSSGASASFSSGTVNNSVARPLSGASITGQQGNEGITRTRGLSGSSSSFSQGTESPANAQPVTGALITGQQGNERAANAQPLTGQSITTTADFIGGVMFSDPADSENGTISGAPFAGAPFAGQVVPVKLAGEEISVAQGTERATNTQPLTGRSATVSVGSINNSLSKGLTGISFTANRGSVSRVLSRVLTSSVVSVDDGIIFGSQSIDGSSFSFQQGNERATNAQPISGVSIGTATGTIKTAQRLTGDDIAIQQGNEIATNAQPLTGISFPSQAGSLDDNEVNERVVAGKTVTSDQGDFGQTRSVELHTSPFVSRASTATYIDDNGVIQTAAVNEPRYQNGELLVEDAATNHRLYSSDFSNTAWVKSNCTVALAGIAAPDGGPAWVQTATYLYAAMGQSAIAVSEGEVWVVSVLAKMLDEARYTIVQEGTGYAAATFNLSNGTFTVDKAIDPKMESLGDGWYRLSAGFRVVSGQTTISPRHWIGSYSGTNYTGKGVYVACAQLERSALTSYIPTTTTAVTRAADVVALLRASTATYIDGDGFIRTAKENETRYQDGKVLIEDSATNYVPYSDCRSGVPFFTLGGTISNSLDATAVGPDNQLGVRKLIVTTAGSIRVPVAWNTGTAGTYYTGSVYIKKASGADAGVNFDVNDTGSTTKTVTSTWQRLGTTGMRADQNYRFFDLNLPVGEFHLYGFQLEEGTERTSLILTGATAESRVADNLYEDLHTSTETGSVTSGVAKQINGIAITSNTGVLVEHNSNPLTGSSITSQKGNVNNVLTVAETGLSISGQTGSIVEHNSNPLSGSSASGQTGSLGKTRANTLDGEPFVAQQGNEGVSRSDSLTGAQITGQQGNERAANAQAITGISMSSQIGSIDGVMFSDPADSENGTIAGAPFAGTAFAGQVVPLKLAGIEISIDQGNERATNAQPLTGKIVTSAAGNVGKSVTRALTGASFSSQSGSIIEAISHRLTGQIITVPTGSVRYTQRITGETIDVQTGDVLEHNSQPLTGKSFGTQIGSVDSLTQQNLSSAVITLPATGDLGSSRTRGITGVWTTFQHGNIVELNANPLTGRSVSSSSGSFGKDRSAELRTTSFVSRTSTATYIDVDGVIQTAAVDEPRYQNGVLLLEDEATNVLLHSAGIGGTGWTNESYVGTRTLNYGVAPDGTTTSTYYNHAGGYSYQRMSLTPGAVYTFSCYVRGTPAPGKGIGIWQYSGSAGVTTSGIIAASTQEINATTWTRCTVTFTASAYGLHSMMVVGNPSNIFRNVEVWGAQLERGYVATSYIPTTTTEATRATDVVALLRDSVATYIDTDGVLRYAEKNEARYQNGVLLVEDEATNLLTYSNEINAVWGQTQPNTKTRGIGPDGQLSSWIITNNGASNLYIYRPADSSYPAPAGTRFRVSCHLKDNPTYGVFGTAGISQGSLVPGTALVEDLGNGWYRHSVTYQTSVDDGKVSPQITIGAGQTVEFFGVQKELGEVTTSYFPTTTGAETLTRAADHVYDLFTETETGSVTSGIVKQINGIAIAIQQGNERATLTDSISGITIGSVQHGSIDEIMLSEPADTDNGTFSGAPFSGVPFAGETVPVILAGQEIQPQTGTARATLSDNISGSAGVVVIGNVGKSVTRILSGIATAVQTGSIIETNANPLTGTAVTTQTGKPSSSQRIAGSAIDIDIGSIIEHNAQPLTGVSFGTQIGSVDSLHHPVLVKQTILVDDGVFGSSRTRGITGDDASIQIGSIVELNENAISGLSVSTQRGDIDTTHSSKLTGISFASQAANLAQNEVNQRVQAGQAVSSQAGTLKAVKVKAISSNTTFAQVGTIDEIMFSDPADVESGTFAGAPIAGAPFAGETVPLILAGQEIDGQTGTMLAAPRLTNIAASFETGSIGTAQRLIGAAITGQTGSIVETNTKAISGVETTVQISGVDSLHHPNLVKQTINTQAGTTRSSRTRSITGVSTTTQTGTLDQSEINERTLSSITISTDAGDLDTSNEKRLTGLSSSSQIGSVGKTRTKTLVGALGLVHTGVPKATLTDSISGLTIGSIQIGSIDEVVYSEPADVDGGMFAGSPIAGTPFAGETVPIILAGQEILPQTGDPISTPIKELSNGWLTVTAEDDAKFVVTRTRGLTGVSTTAQIGSIDNVLAKTPTGISIASQSGKPSAAQRIAGSSVNVQSGSLDDREVNQPTLSGIAITSQIGSTRAAQSIAGRTATFQHGTLTTQESSPANSDTGTFAGAPFMGVPFADNRGVITIGNIDTLTSQTGSLTATQSLDAEVEVVSNTGTIRSSRTRTLTGITIAAQQGSVDDAITVPQDGVAATFSTGSLGKTNSIKLWGISFPARAGSLDEKEVNERYLTGTGFTSHMGAAGVSRQTAMSGTPADVETGDASASQRITGASSTIQQGNEVPFLQEIPTGMSVDIEMGVFGKTRTRALSGAAISSDHGTIPASPANIITGQVITAREDSSISYRETYQLLGQDVWVEAEQIVPERNKSLTGIGISGALGSQTRVLSQELSGLGFATQQGDIASVQYRLPLAGIRVGVVAGSFDYNEVYSVTGSSVNVVAGAAVAKITQSISGIGISSGIGSINKSSAITPTGAQITGTTGTLIYAQKLTGVHSFVVSGATAVNNTRVPATQEVAGQQGEFGKTANTSITGRGVAISLGTLTAVSTKGIDGQRMDSAIGNVSRIGNVELFGQPTTNYPLGMDCGKITALRWMALTGQSMTVSINDIAEVKINNLIPQMVISAQGSLGKVRSKALVGQTITSAAADINFRDVIEDDISGQQTVLSTSDIGVSRPKALNNTHIYVTFHPGILTPVSSLSGSSMGTAIGSLKPLFAYTIDEEAALFTGSLGTAKTVALRGHGMGLSIGAVDSESAALAIGQEIPTETGYIYRYENVSGSSMLSSTGQLHIDKSYTLTGAATIAETGEIGDVKTTRLSGASVSVSDGEIVDAIISRSINGGQVSIEDGHIGTAFGLSGTSFTITQKNIAVTPAIVPVSSLSVAWAGHLGTIRTSELSASVLSVSGGSLKPVVIRRMAGQVLPFATGKLILIDKTANLRGYTIAAVTGRLSGQRNDMVGSSFELSLGTLGTGQKIAGSTISAVTGKMSSDKTAALSGLDFASDIGDVGVAPSKKISGTPATVSIGSVVKSINVGLSGSSIAQQGGKIGSSQRLGGQSATVSTGITGKLLATVLDGSTTAGASGSIRSGRSTGLTGVSMGSEQSTVNASQSLNTQHIFVVPGSVAQLSNQRAVEGKRVVMVTGVIKAAPSDDISGVEIGSIEIGSVAVTKEVGLRGASTNVKQAKLASNKLLALFGVDAEMAQSDVYEARIDSLEGEVAGFTMGKIQTLKHPALVGAEITGEQGEPEARANMLDSHEAVVSGGSLKTEKKISLRGQRISANTAGVRARNPVVDFTGTDESSTSGDRFKTMMDTRRKKAKANMQMEDDLALVMSVVDLVLA